MQQILEAVFERGVFRPLTQPTVADGAHVRLTVESAADTEPDEIVALAARVLQGMSPDEIARYEAVALDRRAFSSPGTGYPSQSKPAT